MLVVVLVLASTSRSRAELRRRLDVPFETAAPRFDEASLYPRFQSVMDKALGQAIASGAST